MESLVNGYRAPLSSAHEIRDVPLIKTLTICRLFELKYDRTWLKNKNSTCAYELPNNKSPVFKNVAFI